MKIKFISSLLLGAGWFLISFFFALEWAREISYILPVFYVWWVIFGIALLPGFLMSCMFFSNLMNRRLKTYPQTDADTTVLLCAHNEEKTIGRAIEAILHQAYQGRIRLIVVDNASSDDTKRQILQRQTFTNERRQLDYLFCPTVGKHNALNAGLRKIRTKYFITVDADTYLEKNAVQRIMDHITAKQSACVAGNLFVENPEASFAAAMQNYDYLLSIAAIKRYQGSYCSTLVAQGAFSAFKTEAVKKAGGWKNVMGEDIVLTFRLLQKNLSSTYEPRAVGYTVVPKTIGELYNQRKRWAIGMLEALSQVPPWKQGNFYSAHFSWVNLSVIDLDLAFLFGMIPAVILALFGYYYLAGVLTLITLLISTIQFMMTYSFQKDLGIPFKNSLLSFLCFLLFFQAIQSTAAVHGYFVRLIRGKELWK